MDKASFKIEKYDHWIRVEFQRGTEVTPEVLMAAMDRENAVYEVKGRYHLWDFRGCHPSPDFGYDAMHRVVEHIENRPGAADWSDKTALLVDESIQYGLSRMFQILVDGYPTQVGIFKEEEAARLWIGQKLISKGSLP